MTIEQTAKRGTGYRPAPAGQRILPFHLLSASRMEATPDHSSIAEFAPGIFNQGGTGSCVGHGTVNGATTSLRAAGIPVAEPLCPLSPYQIARCLERAMETRDIKRPLKDEGTDPDLAMRAISMWGIASMKEMLGVEFPGDEYTRMLAQRVNDEPLLGELENASRFELVGQFGIVSVGAQRISDIRKALASKSAVAIAVYASDFRFQSYAGGILAPPPAGYFTDHYVFLHSYHTDAAGNTVFHGDNSWGTGWGDEGQFHASEGVILASDCINVLSVRRQ